ncbi:hypothetical protein ACHAWF_018473 [Thalassiosira exigua]
MRRSVQAVFGRSTSKKGQASLSASARSGNDSGKGSSSDASDGTVFSNDAYISPMDAFHKFDTDSSGDIDEDEFFHLLSTIGIKGNEAYQERLFRRYVKSGSKTIDYDGFKSAWLLLGNPKQELIDRGIDNLPKFATRHQLVRLLEKTLDDEERLDALAKAEEERYRRLQERRKQRTDYIERATARAGLELAAALDAAGQCYILGSGSTSQFSGPAKKDMSTSSFHQVGFDFIQSLWEKRVGGFSAPAATNTAGIWGRQPRKVVLSDNAVFALTDSGILSWGGASNWHPVSGDESSQEDRNLTLAQTTPRSSSLLMNDERMHRKHLAIIQEEREQVDERRASKIDELDIVLRYYGQWPVHFDGTDDVDMVSEHFLASVSLDQLLRSLLLRGKPCEGNGLTKHEMARMLAKDVQLEKDILGEVGQQELCDMEIEILDLMKRGKTKQSNYLKLKFAGIWKPLLQRRKEMVIENEKREEAERRINHDRQEKRYGEWDSRRQEKKTCSVLEHDGLMAGGITFRGRDLQTPRGVNNVLDIAAGSNHAAVIVKEGPRARLYTWGASLHGRLGQSEDDTEPLKDSNYPNLVGELKHVSVSSVSLGQSHTAAITGSGALYVWGAGSSGQLGFGELPESNGGYFCPIPSRLLMPCKQVRKIGCGACHTACIGTSGELYVWGSSDGGRLGLGRDMMATQHTPVVVESLRHESILDISCGTSTTLALTTTEHVSTNSRRSVKRIKGGRLYVAGPKNVLGQSFPAFGEIESLREKELVIRKISAGYSHQAFVSESGELYCWGHNLSGCCGQDEQRCRFIDEPKKVDWLYEAPNNLALRKPCRLSSLYKDSKGLSAYNAVDGNVDGNKMECLAHTQFEACPYFEVDLGAFVEITHVRLWNRTDEPDDCALHDDMFSKRLFPCYVMISQFPFPNEDLEGKESLDACMKLSVAKIRLTEDTRMSHWEVPKYITGRYVRVQLEDTNFLNFAQLEVFGHKKRSHGPISSCSSGKFVTAAVVGGEGQGIETAYQRAASADW